MTKPKLFPKQRGRKGSKQALFPALSDVAEKLEKMNTMTRAARKKMFLAMSDDEAAMALQILERKIAAEEAAAKR
jgi:hypothetical protein